jgi:septal ring factor EnvC (AmiA/AmiB activator)
MARRVPKDKKTKVPKKYLSGLKGAKRARRASLIKRVSALYKTGKRIPISLLKSRTKA